MAIVKTYILLVIFIVLSCQSTDLPILPEKTNSNLEYFGFTLIDTYWDDPTDKAEKLNYLDEVESFTNMADIIAIEPSDNLVSRIQDMKNSNVRAIIHLSEIFFFQSGVGGNKSGFIYSLREDYQERWNEFALENIEILDDSYIAAFYIGEEPAWNGISENEFTMATDYVKTTFPNINILLVEAFLAIDEMYCPNSVDWIGFDHYFLAQPSTNSSFISELSKLKSLKQSHQKLILIMDSHWIKILHGANGISKNDMDFIARDYYNMANQDPNIVGIIGYFWPSGFDLDGSIGARNLPSHVIEEYKQIGRNITGK